MRDGQIQRFELAHALCHRLQRWLTCGDVTSPDLVCQMTFQGVLRTTNQQGLLRSNWPPRRPYWDLRARTNHAYQTAIAGAVA